MIESKVENQLTETRASEIKRMIDFRLKTNDYIKCLFSVLILDNSIKKTVEELLRRYNHDDDTVDTVAGCWCLNDDWYEFQEDATIEFGGVYPIHWNLGDIIYLEELYQKRKIYINVCYRTKDGWTPIH